MAKVLSKFKSQSGATLVELMVVALIILIVASIAFMSRGDANEQLTRQNASRQLKSALERARFDSVKRRAVDADKMASVQVAAGSFTLRTDVNLNGFTNDSGDAAVTSFSSGIVLERLDGAVLSSSNDTVTFNMRGETSGANPQFRICNVSCSSPTNATSDIVIVTPTGTVNLLPGGASVPSFSPPSLSGTPAAGDGINDDTVMP